MSQDAENRPAPRELVLIASPAGGFEGLTQLVSTIPDPFPAPIVISQYLDPPRMSQLLALLRNRTPLPIEAVESSGRLEAGHLYLVPSNRPVSIKDQIIVMEGETGPRPRPTLDQLLASAAEAYGDRLIVVLLPGAGADGAAGAIEVKNAGGTVVVQTHESNRYSALPTSIPPTVVDFESDIARMGPLLQELIVALGETEPTERHENMLPRILELVSQEANIDFRSYKQTTILRRISRRMAATHNHTMRDYSQYLEDHPEEIQELVRAFLINVTRFFRDPEGFAWLRSELLPQLIERARQGDRVLRFWSAGCATGEEPYSLAMILTDLLASELPEWSIKIFATDLDEASISFARRGIYTDSLLRDVPTDFRERFFERIDHRFRVSKTLRQMVIFGQQDLSRSAPFPRIDLVICRNLLIYFTAELQDYVLNQFAFSLRPTNGFLFLGKAETVRPTHNYYELVNKQWKVYRCTGDNVPVPRRQGLPMSIPRKTIEMPPRSTALITGSRQPGELESPLHPVDLSHLRRLNELLLRFLPIGVVVIDRSYRVLTANGAARRLLALRDSGPEQDFLHAVHGIPYAEVRKAIDTVFRERTSVTLAEVELDPSTGGNGRYVTFSIVLMQMEAGMQELAAVSVSDLTDQVLIRRRLEAAQAEQTKLVSELGVANRRLNDLNKELVDANEELQVANEELMLTHEELQATIEEFETTNEELQATNEELETNNEELQATNEELQTTNDELRSRTSELQELATLLESERVRLAQIVELAPFHIVVLRGPHLVLEAYNHPHLHSRADTGKLIGRPLAEVFETFWENGLVVVNLAWEAYSRDVVRTTPRIRSGVSKGQGDGAERYYTYTIVPSHNSAGKVDGVLIYAEDVTEEQARLVAEEHERLKLIFHNASQAGLALFDAQTAQLLLSSPFYQEIALRAGRSGDDGLAGSRWIDAVFFMPEAEASALWTGVLSSREPRRLPELHCQLARDAQPSVWDWSLTPVLSRDGEAGVCYLLVSVVEITGQVRAREQMEQVDRLKDLFMSIASHELRAPLQVMMGTARRIRRDLTEGMGDGDGRAPVQQDHLNGIDLLLRQADRMNALINQLLALSSLEHDRFSLEVQDGVDLRRLLEVFVDRQRQTLTDRRIDLRLPPNPVEGSCDGGRLEQALSSLFGSALEHSPPQTTLEVHLEHRRGSRGDEALIRLHNHEHEIPAEEQAQLLARLSQPFPGDGVPADGAGLGLYLAHQIVSAHGGRLWLESTPGQGASFFLALPLAPPPSERPG